MYDSHTQKEMTEINERTSNFYLVENQTWESITDYGNGILIYHNVLKKDLDLIKRLEDVLSSSDSKYSFQEAMVGYGMKMPDYRDCFDFKYKKTDIEDDTSDFGEALKSIWQDVYDQQSAAIKDYSFKFNIGELRYWEALNFIKYGPGQHFQEHTDHGYSYNCVLSAVGYINDDYSGGELYFRMQGLSIKPKAGDLVVFPSNFMYPHQAMPVGTGTKYSIVTMLDFSSKFHDPKFYQETGE